MRHYHNDPNKNVLYNFLTKMLDFKLSTETPATVHWYSVMDFLG